jgi:GntR family transcriptional regulator, trigonelline degradation regulator
MGDFMSADALRITENPTLIREHALKGLRDAIISGHFAPGTRLVERELCEAMGISRTSVREVLRQLEAERLVVVEPRRGPAVATISRKQAIEIYEIRAVLEAILIRRFTEKATDEEIATFRSIFEELIAASHNNEVRELVAIMTRFLGHVMEVVDNEIVSDILQQLLARISFLRATSISRPGRTAESIVELRAIVEAVERRDPDAAARYAMIYVGNARDAALERLDATSP